jgi:hypothetical protein
MAYKNIENQRAASKRHYENNKIKYLDRNKKYRQELTAYINKIKQETPCADCGKSYASYVMDFDHLSGHAKLGDISYFCSTGRIGALKKEMLKCELVCANCHRERTHGRLQKDKETIR